LSSLASDYCDQMKSNFKILYAAFPPNEPLKLGDYGLLNDTVFVRIGNVSDLQVDIGTPREFPDQKSNLDFSSEGSVEIDFHGKADTANPPIKAGIDISFSSKHSVFFNAAGCVPTSIADQVALGSKIFALRDAGKWQDKFCVITSLMKAENTTIAVSSSSNSKISFDASSDKIANIDLTDASLSLSVTHIKDVSLKVTTSGGLTPLLGLSGIHQGIFSPDKFGPFQFLSTGAAVAPQSAPTQSGQVFGQIP
jgi:hypothetical protein